MFSIPDIAGCYCPRHEDGFEALSLQSLLRGHRELPVVSGLGDMPEYSGGTVLNLIGTPTSLQQSLGYPAWPVNSHG